MTLPELTIAIDQRLGPNALLTCLAYARLRARGLESETLLEGNPDTRLMLQESLAQQENTVTLLEMLVDAVRPNLINTQPEAAHGACE